jgi:transcriptional regulator with XRE-family HTH domain
MRSPERLQHLRKQKGLTQKALTDAVGMSLIQISRYESGQSQHTRDVLRRLAVSLSVSADELLLDLEGRGPDEVMRLQLRQGRARKPHPQARGETVGGGFVEEQQPGPPIGGAGLLLLRTLFLTPRASRG